MCRNCEDCTAEHPHSTDDSVDIVLDSPVL